MYFLSTSYACAHTRSSFHILFTHGRFGYKLLFTLHPSVAPLQPHFSHPSIYPHSPTLLWPHFSHCPTPSHVPIHTPTHAYGSSYLKMHVVEQTTELRSSKWQTRHQSWVVEGQAKDLRLWRSVTVAIIMVNIILARMFTRNLCMCWPYYTVVFFSGNICVYISVSVDVLIIST